MNVRIPVLMAVVLVSSMGLLVAYEVRRDKPPPKQSAAVPEATAQPRGSLQLAIYHAPAALKEPLKALGPLKAKHQSVGVFEDERDVRDARPPFIVVAATQPTTKYAPPNDVSLEHRARGLTDEDKDAVRASREVTLLAVTLPSPPGAALREVEALTQELADITGGYLWDEQTGDTFTRGAFRERRLETWEGRTPSVPSHVALFFDDEHDDGTVSLETGGMARFGLHELIIRGMSRGQLNGMGDALNALIQRLVEQPELASQGTFTLALGELKHAVQREAQLAHCQENAGKSARVTLTEDRADPSRPRLVVSVPGAGETAAAWEKLYVALYGSADTVQHLEHDAELVQVSKKALETLAKKIKPRFKKGLKPREVLLVKAPFKTESGGNEWMWVDVKSWKGDAIVGTLDSDPEDCPDLEAGDEVTVKEAELFDWTMQLADGKWIGNDTGTLILARQAAAQRAKGRPKEE